MAMKKDDDKSKRTLSGKKPATFGGANSKLTAKKPKAQSPVMVKSLPPVGRDASGSANFNRTAPSRFTGTLGPATINYGGRTPKSTGGTNASNARATNNKESNSTARMSDASTTSSTTAPSTVQGSQKALAEQKSSAKTSRNIALGVGGAMLGAGITVAGGGKKIKQAVKYIADTKNRRARNKIQKAENEAVIVERNKGKATVKASKSTMKKLKGQ